MLDDLLTELGYRKSPFYREGFQEADVSVAHLLRDAQRAHVRGSYFIRTVSGDTGAARERPAVHVAEANTPAEARQIHKQLWNQGTTPFLLISLPGQVRVYTSFAYDENNENIGQVEKPLDASSLSLREIARRLEFLRADSIDSGNIWRTKGECLTKNNRVDRSLLTTLRSLSQELVRKCHLDRKVAHSLIGRFVYLHYLREREILSNEWLAEVGVDPNAVFSGNAKLSVFRRLTDKVDERFNGRIFPIDWTAPSAPKAEAVRAAARAFAGEELGSGQMALFRIFDFSFIPIELLSAIYEQFLHDEGNAAKEGAFYTSEPLADYLLAEVEGVKRLEPGMRVLDPCCGSGIFLVLSYRRLIEQEMRRRRINKLSATELRNILTSSIFGVERNSEACLVTEFSLVLTMLSYIEPPELHHHTKFKFPTLHNEQVFECDFFDDNSPFWKANMRFDWIVGNPPWVPYSPSDSDERHAIAWIRRGAKTGQTPVARYRSSEAFTWRVRERLSSRGVVGLLTQATSLTNEQSSGYRKAFFTQNAVHRITNFSNLVYDLFESAEEPAATIVYSDSGAVSEFLPIIHYGPFIANQMAMGGQHWGKDRASWAITICESEIQAIPPQVAAHGDGITWKQAMWGTVRDNRLLQRLRVILPKTVGELAEKRGWVVSRGLELRPTVGTKKNPADYEASLEQLPLMVPGSLEDSPHRFQVPVTWLKTNYIGHFIRRRGGRESLKLIRHPHLFVCKDFAAFSERDFIFLNERIGVAAPASDGNWLRAISVIWAASIVRYYLFLAVSVSWGIARSRIYLSDVLRMPMPDFSPEQLAQFSKLHKQLVEMEAEGRDRTEVQRVLDYAVAEILNIPAQLTIVAREFFEFRLPLIKGKVPPLVTKPPDVPQLETYARRLTAELDGFLERRRRRHRVTILSAPAGSVATIEIVTNGHMAEPTVRTGVQDEQKDVADILLAAEQTFSQWIYVRRSVRLFADSKIHLCKPARRLEWTETQALLDAADIIAEVAEAHGRNV